MTDPGLSIAAAAGLFTFAAALGWISGRFAPRRARATRPEPAPLEQRPVVRVDPPVLPRVGTPRRTLEVLNRELEAALKRCADLEQQVAHVSERAGRRATEIRNFEARMQDLTLLAAELDRRDARIAALQQALADAQRDASLSERVRLAEENARLRSEVDWREFVIRELEPEAERRAQALKQARVRAAGLVAQLAERDALVRRLRAAQTGAATAAAAAA
jgi:hypothetical protein